MTFFNNTLQRGLDLVGSGASLIKEANIAWRNVK